MKFEDLWRAEWGRLRYEVDEVIDLGDRLLVVGRVSGSGPSSGASFDSEFAEIFTFRAGRVIREEAFFDRAAALKAVGPPE